MKPRQALWILVPVAALLLPELTGIRYFWGPHTAQWVYPIAVYIRSRLASGHLPLWNPYIYGGMPLIGHPDWGIFYPFNLWVGVVPPLLFLAWNALFHLVMAGVGLALWLRMSGCRNMAAVLGGLAFATSASMMGFLDHPSRLEVAAWWPWLLICLDRGWPLGAALVMAVQGLAGDPFGVLLSGIAAFVVIWIKQRDQEGFISSISLWLPALGTGACLAAVQWLPYSAMWRRSMRYHVATLTGPQLALHDLPRLLLPGATLFDRALPLLVLLLALLVWRKQSSQQWLSAQGLAVLVFVGIVMALGLSGPAGRLDALLQQRLSHVADLGNSTFAWQILERMWRGIIGDEPMRWLDYSLFAVCGLAAFGLEAVAERLGEARGRLVLGLWLAVAANCLAVAWFCMPPRQKGEVQPPPQWADVAPVEGRLAIADNADPRMLNWGCAAQVQNATGTARLAPRDTLDFIAFAAWGRTADEDDSKNILQHECRVPTNVLNTRVMRAIGVRQVYDENLQGRLIARTVAEPLPRFRIAAPVPGWMTMQRLPDETGSGSMESGEATDTMININLLNHLDDSQVDLLHQTLLDQMADVHPGPRVEVPVSVKLVSETPERLVLDATTPDQALLVDTDAFDAGWQATVNGLRRPVYEADGISRAVPLFAGKNHVVVEFNPIPFRSGIAVSLGTILLLILGRIWREIRPRRKASPLGDPVPLPPASTQAAPPEPSAPLAPEAAPAPPEPEPPAAT
ncbi:MAG: hypothetical protein ACYCW6_05110 [Candidatus Xenobia bacterium]